MVRVLVGRIELITPEMELETLETIKELGQANPIAKENAMANLNKRGRFMEPVLRRLLDKIDDPILAERIRSLLAVKDAR